MVTEEVLDTIIKYAPVSALQDTAQINLVHTEQG